jgi:osmotically-inducible protein OsmY
MKTDKQITANVIQALLWDARVSPVRLDVETFNGKVTLSGRVDNFHKKWSAIDTAMKVSEVLEVIDEIKVEPTDVVEDALLQKSILETLKMDSRLEHKGISCSVQNGSVTLKGEVRTFYQKIAAEESCRWVKGVINVKNYIKVLPHANNLDKQIERRISELIKQNMRNNKNDIKIVVENGIVTLSGHVGNIMNKVYAETMASMVSNVSFVQNNIVIHSNIKD